MQNLDVSCYARHFDAIRHLRLQITMAQSRVNLSLGRITTVKKTGTAMGPPSPRMLTQKCPFP